MAYTQAPVQVIKMADGGSPAMETWGGEDPPPDGQGWQRYNRGKGDVVYQRPAPAQQIYRGEDPPPASEGYTRVRTGRDDYIYTRPMEPPVAEMPVAPPVQAVPTTGEAAAPIAPYVPYTPPIAPSVASPTEVIAPPYVPLTNRAMPAYVPYTPPTRGTARYNNANAYTNVFNPTPTELPIYPPTNAVASPHAPYNNANAYTNLRKPPPMAVSMYSSGGSVTPVPMYSPDGTQINQDFNNSYDNLLLDYYPTGRQIENRGGGRTAPEGKPGEGFNPSPAFARSMLNAGKSLSNYPVVAPLGIAAQVAGALATKYGSYLSSVAERNAAAENAAKNPNASRLGVQSSRVHDQLRSNEAYGSTLDGPPPSGERGGSQVGGGYGGGAATGGRDTGGGTRDASGGGDRGTRGGFAHGGIADPHLYNLLAKYYANYPR